MINVDERAQSFTYHEYLLSLVKFANVVPPKTEPRLARESYSE